MNLGLLKREFRKRTAAALAALAPEESARQSRIVRRKLFELPAWKSASRVSVYLSIGGEIATDEIVEAAFADGKACFVPICRNDRMKMLQVRGLEDLRALPANSWGIREPLPVEGREDALETGGLDVVVVPGVAFTARGHRLGHGKGYYDRFFELCAERGTTPSRIALALREQVFDEVPTGERDVPVDVVLYET